MPTLAAFFPAILRYLSSEVRQRLPQLFSAYFVLVQNQCINRFMVMTILLKRVEMWTRRESSIGFQFLSHCLPRRNTPSPSPMLLLLLSILDSLTMAIYCIVLIFIHMIVTRFTDRLDRFAWVQCSIFGALASTAIVCIYLIRVGWYIFLPISCDSCWRLSLRTLQMWCINLRWWLATQLCHRAQINQRWKSARDFADTWEWTRKRNLRTPNAEKEEKWASNRTEKQLTRFIQANVLIVVN